MEFSRICSTNFLQGLQHETGANVGAASMEKDNNGEQDTEKKVGRNQTRIENF